MAKIELHGTKKLRLRKNKCQNNLIFKPIRWSILTILLLATGCADRESLLKEIGEFDQALQTGTEAIAAYYTSINEQEMRLYVLTLDLNPNCELGDRINYNCLNPQWDRQSGQWFDSPLKKQVISPESLEVRLELLKELSNYSKNLAALAGDDSAEKFKGNVTTLTERLTSLEMKLGELQKKAENNENNETNSATAETDLTISDRYIIPLGKIIGILGAIIIQEIQWEAIQKAIIEAEEPINTILTEIAVDMDTYLYPLISTGADARYSLLVNEYNEKQEQLKPAERKALLNQVIDSKTAYDLAVATKPSKIPLDLKNTHTKLVKLAKSDGNPKDLAEVKSWLERFKQDVEQLVVIVKQIKQIQGE